MTYENVGCIFLLLSLNMFNGNLYASSVEADPLQVVITEIMADPTPVAGLPAYEFIELYNRSDHPVNLEGWKLTVGSHTAWLPATVLQPRCYAIICDDSAASSFNQYGTIISLRVFPPVLNSGQTITLYCNSDVIHSVTFTDDWYGDPVKAGGGWTLEMTDPENACGGTNNWKSSADVSGGTPGRKNSIYAPNPDLESPQLLRAIVPSDSSVELVFNEPMNFETLSLTGNYSVSNGFFEPRSVFCPEPGHQSIVLEYPGKFSDNTLYTVSVMNSLTDCAGNQLEGNLSVYFGLPRESSSTDIVFNEVLFNPGAGDAEFIEIYNRSEKFLNLADLAISLSDKLTGDIERTITFSDNPFLIIPDDYLVLTRNTQWVLENHPIADERKILQVPLFILPDEEAILLLRNAGEDIIDELHYNCLMHHRWLEDTKGVSLERINPGLPSSDPSNWESASSSSGFASPCAENSQSFVEGEEDIIVLSSDYLSPDTDGIDDELILSLHMPEPGWIGTVMIYNMGGLCMRTIFTNYLMGTTENFTWDGLDTQGNRLAIGLYIIYGEFFNKKGSVKNFKKVVAVVKK